MLKVQIVAYDINKDVIETQRIFFSAILYLRHSSNIFKETTDCNDKRRVRMMVVY